MLRQLGIVLALSALLCAACTRVTTQAGPAGAGNAHPWTKPGVLRLSDISEPSTLNPMITGADVAYQLASYTLEYLVQLDDKGNIIPVLCDEVPSAENGLVSKDGLTVTYHLRRNVTWSDGQPFTAHDVVATWRQVMNPRNNVQIREGYDVIDRIDEPDGHTAVVHLKRPYAPLPTRFFSGIQEGPIPVMPAHLIEKLPELNDAPYSSKPIGTGPFIVTRWQHGVEIDYEANPHYWRGAPKLKRLIFQALPSDTTELIRLKTHETDADIDATLAKYPDYATLSGMRATRSKSLRLSTAVLNTSRPPFDDPRVRQAFLFMLDRERLVKTIARGAGYVADELLPTWSWAYTPDVPKYPHDPARAAQLLDEAGWKLGPDGFRAKDGKRLSWVMVGTTGSTSFMNTATIVQEQARALGIEATQKTYSYGIVFNTDGPIRTGRYDVAFFSFSVNYDPSALSDDGCDQFAPKGANDPRLCDKDVDRLERQGLVVQDRATRKKIYAEIQRRRMTNLGFVPLYFRDRVSVYNDDLHGFTASSGILPEWNAWQWSIP